MTEPIQLRFLGRTPLGQTNNLATKKYVDEYFAANGLVNQAWVNDECDIATGNLLLQSDVNSTINATDGTANRLYPKFSQLVSSKAAYAESSLLGFANGVAKADTAGALPSVHIHPDIKLDNKATTINAITDARSTVYLSNTYTATTSSIVEYRAASITIQDPGFSYYPMNFVCIQGKSSGTTETRSVASNNVGLITVGKAPASSGQLPLPIFAQGVCSASPYQSWHMALPHANKWTASPPVRAVKDTTALRGDLTLNLYLSNYAGSGYTYYAAGLVWTIVLFPTNTSTVSG